MICTAEQARYAVAACKYPPIGNRGCGVRRGSRYGSIPWDEYEEAAKHTPFIILQIEHE